MRQDKVKPDLIKKRPGWSSLKAVQDERILVLEEALYCRPSPLLLKGAVKLAKILHPDEYAHM